MSWIQPSGKYGMHIFTCDFPGVVCEESRRAPNGRDVIRERTEFRSASVKSVLAKQLIAAGWTIAVKPAHGSPVMITLESLTGTKDRIYLCPKHRPQAKPKWQL